MFKIEVDVNGTTHHHYWMNKHEDDFLKFLPKHFTNTYGEEITKDDITVYLVDEDKFDLLEGKIKQHDANELAFEAGKIKVARKEKAAFKEGDEVPEETYNKLATEREDKFKTAKIKKPKKSPKVKNGMVTIAADDELAQDVESVELELTGTPLVKWPYDKKGKFTGNK